MIKRRGITVMLLVVVIAMMMVVVQGNTFAAKYNLRAAHYFNKDFAWNKGLEYFGRLLNERSDGQIALTIYGNGVLSTEADYLQNMMNGALDFAVADHGLLRPAFPFQEQGTLAGYPRR